eukprot:6492353-Amphidinium_carterae.2
MSLSPHNTLFYNTAFGRTQGMSSFKQSSCTQHFVPVTRARIGRIFQTSSDRIHTQNKEKRENNQSLPKASHCQQHST